MRMISQPLGQITFKYVTELAYISIGLRKISLFSLNHCSEFEYFSKMIGVRHSIYVFEEKANIPNFPFII